MQGAGRGPDGSVRAGDREGHQAPQARDGSSRVDISPSARPGPRVRLGGPVGPRGETRGRLRRGCGHQRELRQPDQARRGPERSADQGAEASLAPATAPAVVPVLSRISQLCARTAGDGPPQGRGAAGARRGYAGPRRQPRHPRLLRPLPSGRLGRAHPRGGQAQGRAAGGDGHSQEGRGVLHGYRGEPARGWRVAPRRSACA